MQVRSEQTCIAHVFGLDHSQWGPVITEWGTVRVRRQGARQQHYGGTVFDRRLKAWDLEGFVKRAENEMALKRRGQADEVVDAALYFAGASSSFTTGSRLRVGGGT
jgi:hypothetical protein